MTASLTTLISTVQAMLLDTGTNYTTATCTAAVRQALKEFNDAAPQFAAEQIATVANQHEYELSGGDFNAGVIDVLTVQLVDLTGDNETPIKFREYTEDNRVYIRLDEAQTAGKYIIISFTTPNTINGLDSAVISTIPSYFDQVIVDGGAYYSIVIRSVGRVEPINLNRDVPKLLQSSARAFQTAFEIGKMKAGKRKPRRANVMTNWNFSPTGF